MTKFTIRNIGASLMIFLFSSAAIAQDIPKELMDLGLKECNTGCTPSFGKKVCAQLCSCSMNAFKKKMKLPAYLELQAALVKGETTPDQRKIMDDIAKKCDSELTIKVPAPAKPVPAPVPAPGEKKEDKDDQG